MKIRSICLGLLLNSLSLTTAYEETRALIDNAKFVLEHFSKKFAQHGFEVQTVRLSLNSIDDWLPLPGGDSTREDNERHIRAHILKLVELLDAAELRMCAIGGCSSKSAYVEYMPFILSLSEKLSSCVRFDKSSENGEELSSNFAECQRAAAACLDLHKRCGDLGNFRFCSSFNCLPGTPFFPTSFNGSELTNSNKFKVSIGLENGDLLYIAFFGATTFDEARDNLKTTLIQVLKPIQDMARECERELAACSGKMAAVGGGNVEYMGIDASLNPGLSIPDSVGAGLEAGLLCMQPSESESESKAQKLPEFGCWGTLAAVSAVTSAIKSIPSSTDIKLIGYNGFMLPVMEDLILSQRTNNFTMRDLLMFSSICGVGIDTVPVPDSAALDVRSLAGLYQETSALAFRLNKPLTVRVLPMAGKKAGDTTEIVSPYLCDTKVFAL